MNVEPVAKTESGGLRLSLRSETRFAAVGLIVVGVFLISMWAATWWAMCAQRDALDQARLDQMQVTGASLARCAEVMLADGEVTALRRIVAQTAQDAHLERCRIVLPGGRVVADANPADITLRELPAQWPGGAAVLPAEGPPAPLVFTLVVPQRGSAVLEMARTEDLSQTSYWLTQAGIGGICVTALLALLVLYRRVRAGLRGICAVREALLAREHGQTTLEALEVNPEWGPEARAWNDMLGQEGARQKHVALEKTRETLQARVCGTDRLTVACDALSQGLILLEKNLRATYVNSAAALLLQAKREDMLSADITSFVKDERVVAAARAAAGNGAMQRRTIVEVQRNGETGGGVLRFIVRPVRRDDTGVAMIVVEDITQQRAAEEARHTFVAQATHELRTPLTNIRLYTEMALEEGQKDPAVLKNCLSIINQETFRLDRTVADILSIAEIEAGTMTVRRDDVRLEEIFPELQADYEAQARGKQVELEFRLPPKLPVLKGDREKIRSALHNLVGNALKYTPAGGQVRVAVKVDQDQLVVDVSDTGIGMTEEDRQHLFEKFYRAKDPRVAKVTGSGLGLAIAREVIRLHGGDIVVESELNRGSTFTLTLPVPPEGA
ncbi:MAG: ATP-binding protein [Planctomycetota bacterium]|nr:ATP-binding protein [Planctomycetota bacterium]